MEEFKLINITKEDETNTNSFMNKKSSLKTKKLICILFILIATLFFFSLIIFQDRHKILSTFGFYTSSDCPTPSWVYCRQEGRTCNIPSTIKYTTVAYGINGKWTFQDFTNFGESSLSIGCNNNAFGDIYGYEDKICCYDPSANSGPTTSSSSWLLIGEEDSWVSLPNGMYLVRYGANNVYTYRYIEGEFSCSNYYFSDPIPYTDKSCYRLNTAYSSPTWINCGSEDSNSCNLKVDNAISSSMRLVKYGISTNGKTQYSYRSVYSSNGDIPCNNHLFDDPYGGEDKYCYVSSTNSSTQFSGAVGSWQQVGSCSNCALTLQLSYGVTSTTENSKTETWSNSLTTSIETECSFQGSGVKTTLSTTVGRSIATTMSSSFTKSVSKSCSATCGSTGQWYMYQWSLTVGEYSGLSFTTFNAYGCNYICVSTNISPKCPLNLC